MTNHRVSYQEKYDHVWTFDQYQNISFERAMIDRVMHQAKKYSAQRILCIGPGMGHGMRRLLEEGFDAYGVEVSETAIKECEDLRDRIVQVDFTRVTEPIFENIDFIYAVDLLQQIYPEDLDSFLKALQAQNATNLYFVIDLMKDRFDKETIGHEMNVCARHAQWWEKVIGDYFRIKKVTIGKDNIVDVCSISACPGRNSTAQKVRNLGKDEGENARTRFFKKNLETLALRKELGRDRDALTSEQADYQAVGIKIYHTPDGSPIPALPIDDSFLAIEDNLDPRGKAIEWARKQKVHVGDSLVIMLGFGFGYSVEELLRICGPRTHILCIEPFLPLMRAAMEHRDLHMIFSDARFHLIMGMDEVELVTTLDLLALEYPHFRASCMALREQHALLLGEDVAEFMHMAAVRFDRNARGRAVGHNMSMGWAQKNLRNIHWTLDHPGLEAFQNGPKIPAAVLVAAGPTMTKALPFLRKMKNRLPIIACDVALKKLMEEDIHPHMATCLDASELVFDKTKVLDPDQTGLLLYNQVHKNFADLPAKFKVCLLEQSWNSIMQPVYKRKTTTKWSFVGGMQLSAAVDMGIRKLYLVGMDFAFAPDGETHFEGAGLERGKKHMHGEEWLSVKGNSGEQLRTSHSLHTFLSQFNDYVHINGAGLELIPVTDGGAQLANLKPVDPAAAMAFCDEYPETDWREIMADTVTSTKAVMDAEAQHRFFRTLARDFLKYRKLLNENNNHKKFLDIMHQFLTRDCFLLNVNAMEEFFHCLNDAQNFKLTHINMVRDCMNDLAPYVEALLTKKIVECTMEI